MSLKALIQRLLDSRTTPAEAAHSAMPSTGKNVNISPTMNDDWVNVVAPFDGYLSVGGIARRMLISNESGNWSGLDSCSFDRYMGFTIPVTKGTQVRYKLSNTSTNVRVFFTQIIGGGV